MLIEEIENTSLTEEEIEAAVNKILENKVLLSNDESFSCMLKFTIHGVSTEKLSSAVVLNVLKALQQHNNVLFNSLSERFVSELIDPKELPSKVVGIAKHLLVIPYIEEIVSKCISEKLLQILKSLQNQMNLDILLEIASLIETNVRCLPPVEENLELCSEVTNQLLSFSVPSLDKYYPFMNKITKASMMIQKCCFISPDVILPLLSNIYTLISSSK